MSINTITKKQYTYIKKVYKIVKITHLLKIEKNDNINA